MRLTPLQAHILQLLEQAAHAGKVCPQNRDIAAIVGCSSSSVNSALYALIKKSKIKIVSRGRGQQQERIVEILRNRMRTLPPQGWNEFVDAKMMTRPATPCFRCGSRFDACQTPDRCPWGAV